METMKPHHNYKYPRWFEHSVGERSFPSSWRNNDPLPSLGSRLYQRSLWRLPLTRTIILPLCLQSQGVNKKRLWCTVCLVVFVSVSCVISSGGRCPFYVRFSGPLTHFRVWHDLGYIWYKKRTWMYGYYFKLNIYLICGIF